MGQNVLASGVSVSRQHSPAQGFAGQRPIRFHIICRPAFDSGWQNLVRFYVASRQPLWNALWSVAINWRLEFLCKEYKLDEEQRGEACGLLKQRREHFLALVDSTPPPSISYSELARQAQKLADPGK